MAFKLFEAVEGMKVSQNRGSMKFLATGQQRTSRIMSQSSTVSNKNFTQMRSSIHYGDDLRKRTPATSIRFK